MSTTSNKRLDLLALADRIDSEQLWRWPLTDHHKLTPNQRDRLAAGVALRRYADLWEPGCWVVFPPVGPVHFSAGTLAKACEMAERHTARRAAAITTYNTPGHVCPVTGRLAMTVADAYARDDSPDRHFLTYNREAAEMNMEPWGRLDGIDATVEKGTDGRPVGYTLDFASWRSMDVKPDFVVYMQRTKAEREADAS